MIQTRDPLAELADDADALTEPYTYVVAVPGPRRPNRHPSAARTARTITTPSLLQQLATAGAAAAPPGVGARTAPGSKPPGAWVAIATHTVITLGAAWWCWELRIDQRQTVEGNIRALVGAAGSLDGTQLDQLAHDIADWRRQARETLAGLGW